MRSRSLLNHFFISLLFLAGSANAEALPDPTRPAEYQSGVSLVEVPRALVDWKVTAIRITENDRTAIVNGKIVREGDTIGTAKILEIQPVSVVLTYENKQVSVRLYSDLVQKKFRDN